MKTQRRIASMLLLALALLALAVTPSFADPVNVYSTGAGLGSGGVSDPNYQLVSAPTGAGPAYTLPAYAGWVSPPAGTQWINPGGGSTPAGNYDYQTTFDLTGLDPGSLVLSGSWAADNAGSILLNGAAAIGIGTTIPDPYGFKNLTAFSITGSDNAANLHPGLNTLDFVVQNDGSVTGLLVQISGTASPTPEPSSLVLLGSGLLGIAGIVRRKLLG